MDRNLIASWKKPLPKQEISKPQKESKKDIFVKIENFSKAKQLFEDYQSLMQLGGEYGKFDREGKKIFIEKMETLMERYKIFMKRFELSEDFMAQMTLEQLKTQLGQVGMTPHQMFHQMHMTLERMKLEIKEWLKLEDKGSIWSYF